MTLKEDKKNALFGDILAGGDLGSHVKSSVKAYQFSDKQQIAALQAEILNLKDLLYLFERKFGTTY